MPMVQHDLHQDTWLNLMIIGTAIEEADLFGFDSDKCLDEDDLFGSDGHASSSC